jgi:hypothetical protein
MLARAVADVFDLECVDGSFLVGFDHSWIKTRQGNILDVYPVAILGGPLLVDGQPGSPARQLYFRFDGKELKRRYGHKFETEPFLRATAIVTREVRRNLRRIREVSINN